jgi:peptidoglycan hydrolase-like protein with peptidoglycan-binding domain
MYFVVRDDIVIVDRSRHIVAVIAADGAPSQARGSAAAFVDLSADEIRLVQTVLIERGFLIGVADGEFGPRTRDALTRFQRKEGISVSGRIDTGTVSSLGLSAKIDASKTGGQTQGQGSAGTTSRQPATTGSGQSSQPSTSGQQAPAAPGRSSTSSGQQGSASPPATSGQGQQSQQQPAQKQAPASKGSDSMPSSRPAQSSGSGAASGSTGGSAQ